MIYRYVFLHPCVCMLVYISNTSVLLCICFFSFLHLEIPGYVAVGGGQRREDKLIFLFGLFLLLNDKNILK